MNTNSVRGVLDERGWVEGNLITNDGHVCLIGAWAVTAGVPLDLPVPPDIESSIYRGFSASTFAARFVDTVRRVDPDTFGLLLRRNTDQGLDLAAFCFRYNDEMGELNVRRILKEMGE